jgi:hypothetical protein
MLDLIQQVSGTLLMCLIMGLVIYYLNSTFGFSHMWALIIGGSIVLVLYSLYLFLFERKLVNKVLEITKIKEKVLNPLFNIM